ncbi:MAG: YbaK/EbsC family protein [Candidatus Subteraquimicrobiales bacterium]|nr:YbaK/EbsC family protein [Candidatus Subteraquimicrobiales bacterium]
MRTSVDVHNFLLLRNVLHEICLLSAPAMTAEKASALMGIDLTEIVKSVIVFADKSPFLIMVPGNKKASYKKIKMHLGARRTRLALPEEVVEITGYALGATPPFAFQMSLRTLMDESIMAHEVVYTASGEVGAILKIRPADLKEATSAEVADLTE